MAPDIDVGDRLLDLGHMARDALVPTAARLVMRVLLDGGGVRPVGRVRAMTVEAQDVGRLPQHCVIVVAMHVVTTEAGDAALVHQADGEVVALHAILVSGAVAEVGEGGLPEFVRLQFPEIT